MTTEYTEETQTILSDFLNALTRDPRIDASFLNEMRQMLTDGELGNPSRIEQAIATLERRAYGRQNQ